jgi:hypothetical protein
LRDGPDVKVAADVAAVAFANELELTNLGPLPFGDTYGRLKLNSLWGPCVMPRFENMQVIGAATVNGSMCLVHTSYTPIVGLLREMEVLLGRVRVLSRISHMPRGRGIGSVYRGADGYEHPPPAGSGDGQARRRRLARLVQAPDTTKGGIPFN